MPQATASPASPRLDIKFDDREFRLWIKQMRDKDVKRVSMKVLKGAGFDVMKRERMEVRRAFATSGRPATAAYVSNAILYEPFDRLNEVWVGPFRKPGKAKGAGRKRTGLNAKKIIADHVEGSSFSPTSSGTRGLHATRLVTDKEVAVPVKAFKRGGTGKLAFGKIARGLTRESAFNIGKDLQGRPIGNKGFRIQPYGGDPGQKTGPTFLAVRSKKRLAGTWGWKQGPRKENARTVKGKRKGKRRIAVTHPIIVPLFILVKNAKVKPVIRFYSVAQKVARASIHKRFQIEFVRGLKSSARFGAPMVHPMPSSRM